MYKKRDRLFCVIIIVCILISLTLPEMSAYAQTAEELSLHSLSAVLMDGNSGRVLYGKNEEQALPVASTTKIMTLLIALEKGNPEDVVTVSSYAASMPDVQLGIRAGEQYLLKDLMYSMMLESHNDSAVAIAEHIGGSVETFAEMMNEKAESIGCESVHFITPNGLDGEDNGGIHSASAKDMALIMRYAILNDMFLELTRTQVHTFEDINHTRNFTVNNKNALLTMTEDALSGKTGFTGKAGYCYVCAAVSEGRTFIITLLGCGWPPNKTWKWSDVMKLLDYGKENFELKEVGIRQVSFEPVKVIGGLKSNVPLESSCMTVNVLLGKNESFEVEKTMVTQVQAPVIKGSAAGMIRYKINGQSIAFWPVVFGEDVEKSGYGFYIKQVVRKMFQL